MPLNGLGAYTAPTPEYPAIPNTTILASDFNTIIEDLEVALSLAIYKDGQASMAANLNMATFKVINLGTGTNPADATTVLQVFTNPTFTGTTGTGVVITGTKATVTPSVLDLTVPDINISGTTLDIVVPTTNITSTTALTLTSPDISMISSASMDVTAGTTIAETATTSITLTAPTVAIVGSLTATLTSPSTAVTQAVGTSNTTIATTAFASALAFSAALPNQAGNSGKFVTTDGTNASWSALGKLYKTTTVTLEKGKEYLLDTTAGAFTATMPATPTIGDTVTVGDPLGTWGTNDGANSVTLVRNGSNFVDQYGTGQAEDYELNINNLEVTFIYTASGWRAI